MSELVSDQVEAENLRRAEEQARAAAKLASEYRAVFDGTPAGLHVWEDLQRVCFFGATTGQQDAQGRVDLGAMAVNEGARGVGLYIRDQIAAGRRAQDGPPAPRKAVTTL